MERLDNPLANFLISKFVGAWFSLTDRRVLIFSCLNPRAREAEYGDLVSVIVPTFNREDLLFSRCLPSVLGQSYENIEVLVVSHGSTDGTARRVAELASRDSRVRLIEIGRASLGYPNRAQYHWFVGPVKPINSGLRVASGRWIARIDDDDEWFPEHLETLVRVAADRDLDFVSGAYEVRGSDNDRVVKPEGIPPVGGVQTWVYRAYLAPLKANIHSWRKSWNRVNDLDLQQRLISLGIRIGAIPTVTARIRPRAGEVSVGSKAYAADPGKVEARYGVGRHG
jgi:glycosyltransferase involved in cell wall biosynthesis